MIGFVVLSCSRCRLDCSNSSSMCCVTSICCYCHAQLSWGPMIYFYTFFFRNDWIDGSSSRGLSICCLIVKFNILVSDESISLNRM
jgi:hypothetical protein